MPASLKIQASNPIYEGAIYETTPGESVKSLFDSTSCPNTPSAELNCRYIFDAPELPAPRKVSKRETCETNHDLTIASPTEVEIPPEYGSLSADKYMSMTAVLSSNATVNDNISG